MNKYNRKYYEANKEKIRAYAKDYYKVYNKVYYQANKEKYKAYAKVYYKANKEKWRNYSKVYRKNFKCSAGEELDYWKMYYKLNKQKYIDYYDNNRQKRKEYSKNYYLTKQKKTITEKYNTMLESDRYTNMLNTINIPLPITEIKQEVRILEFK